MNLLAVDPGVRGAGCAVFDENGQLVAAARVKNPADKRAPATPAMLASFAEVIHCWADAYGPVRWVVLEVPRTYGGRARDGADPNDLISLALLDGALASQFKHLAEVAHYWPEDWKGSTSKPGTVEEGYPVVAMVRRRLNHGELVVFDCAMAIKNVRHSWDVADAVGIGLKFFKRFEPRRVYARD